MPDHDGSAEAHFLLINGNLRDDNRIQYLLEPADGRFDLPLVGFPRRSCLVAPGRESLLLFEQVVQALFQPIRALAGDVIPGAGWKLRPKGRRLLRAGFII